MRLKLIQDQCLELLAGVPASHDRLGVLCPCQLATWIPFPVPDPVALGFSHNLLTYTPTKGQAHPALLPHFYP
uniref:Uncharacterized protein n=1 Tax=Anguilla anguilla TaxID=7936 RepID=A0A0E9P5D9_ANGAN